MTFRIAGDADGADAPAPQGAAIDGIERPPQRSALGAVAGNDENVGDAGLAVEPRKEIIECCEIGEIAHGDMRHRLEAGGAQPDCSAERFIRRAVRYRAEINACAALERGERGDVGIRRPRRLDGESLYGCGDPRDRIGRRLILSCERGHLSVLALQAGSERRAHARRREITYDSSKNHRPPRSRSTERVASR
jgi:hypothetical protein